jgi:hypothetical protein
VKEIMVRESSPPLPHLLISESESYAPSKKSSQCDICGEQFEGEPAGRGLYLWTRGDEVRFEEPVLCPKCSPAIAIAGERFFSGSGDDGSE